MSIKLRITGKQYRILYEHLFPGDGLEAIAFAECGTLSTENTLVLCVQRIITIPRHHCKKTKTSIVWQTNNIVPILSNLQKKKSGILLKIHSHPPEWQTFSEPDNRADYELSQSVIGWTDYSPSYASMIMTSDGFMQGRVYQEYLTSIKIDSRLIAGDSITKPHNGHVSPIDTESQMRTIQVFGEGTISVLRNLKIAVVGCSGTGSIVIEQLARLGVGSLIMVDPDVIEDKNLNRIINAKKKDAIEKSPKVEVLERTLREMDLGTEVIALKDTIFNPLVIKKVAEADILFGCTDSIESRNVLNLIAVHYCMPYIDIGVGIDADGKGGVTQVAGSVHYLQPDGSSLLSRRVYTPEELASEAIHRTQPKEYDTLLRDGYIRGVKVERPAVISVNMLAASLAVNELLARIHNYRDDGNSNYAVLRFSLTQSRIISEDDRLPCKVFSKYVGKGDCVPPLGLPFLCQCEK